MYSDTLYSSTQQLNQHKTEKGVEAIPRELSYISQPFLTKTTLMRVYLQIFKFKTQENQSHLKYCIKDQFFIDEMEQMCDL